ncbi:MAG TPA: GNAT family N-acetyltransferase [Anaerolineales bacterium]|nr:GNAT family N-acetyltransferase [Anaerolineales bacterium]HNS61842.1 GNAT family N-acetyltransferase [Anaerolineales bacterium]
MINTFVRHADSHDHQKLSNLIFYETRLHRHLDWRSPLDWLGSPFYWAIDDRGRIDAALACPPEAPGAHWIRFFVHSGNWTADNAWSLLWHEARETVARSGGVTVAAIVMQPWFERALAQSGFETRQDIVMLEWKYQPWARKEARGVQIRKMTEADLLSIEKIDLSAFGVLWHNPIDTLRAAFSKALFASVAEDDREILGYQITTGEKQRAHLARLAVTPAAQGRGVGGFLVGGLLTRLLDYGIGKLSVNTQSDNGSSLALYEKMGFTRTGERYPVYVFDVNTMEASWQNESIR